MSFANFIAEVWSANVDTAMRKNLVYGGGAICNREYEGVIRSQGDTVKVTSVGRPTIGNYNPAPGPNKTVIVPEPINAGQRTFSVDQSKYWALEVDDVDKAQARADLMPTALNEAGYATADLMDQYVAGLHTQIPAGQTLNNGATIEIDLSDPDTIEIMARRAYNLVVVPAGIMLDELNVPEEGRYMVLPPWFYGALRRDSRFVEAQRSGTTAVLRRGEVGDSGGFTFFKSNNVPQPTPGEFVVTAGTNRAITFASQITEIEAYRPESGFSDAVKSLHVYGAKVFRPDSIIKAKLGRLGI